MSLSSTQDLLYFVAAFVLLWITAFLCWALYEIAKLVHQANAMVSETREKVSRFEKAVVAIGEKLGGVTAYLGLIAEGGKQLMSFLHAREEKHDKRMTKKPKSKELSDMPSEE